MNRKQVLALALLGALLVAFCSWFIATQDIFFGPFNGDRIVPIVMLYLNNNL